MDICDVCLVEMKEKDPISKSNVATVNVKIMAMVGKPETFDHKPSEDYKHVEVVYRMCEKHFKPLQKVIKLRQKVYEAKKGQL